MTYTLPTEFTPPLPPSTQLLQNLTTQSHLLTELFTLLSSPTPASYIPPAPSLTPTTHPPPHPMHQLYAALQASTDDLARLVDDAHRHQAAHFALDRRKREVVVLEGQVRALVRALEEGRRELEAMVHEGRAVRASIEKSTSDPIPVRPLLAHAQALARTSSAPVSSLLAPVDRVGAEPWPNEVNMRMGLLFRLEGSMGGVGDVGVIGDEQGLVEPAMEVEEPSVQREERGRRFDPDAVFQLDLNSDESDDE